MKRMKMLGIVALAAMVVFGMTACGEDLCVDGHTWGNWTQVDGTAAGERECTVCGEKEPLTKEHFEGKWVTSTNSNTIEISASGDLKVYNASTVATNYWTLTGATWAAEESQTSSISNYTTIKASYPIGFRLSGGTTGGSATNSWSANDAGTASVYINATGDKIVVRLTNAYLTDPTIREFTKQ